MSNLELAIVIPVYNEQGCIAKVLNEWKQELSEITNSITFIVVNDGSTDKTSQILNDQFSTSAMFHVIHQKNGGHGKAVLNGYQCALEKNAEWIFQVDSDDQFDPKDFQKLWSNRNNSQAIFGHRKDRKDPIARKFISHMMSGAIEALFGVTLLDPNVPFRLIKKSLLSHALEQIPPHVFAPNIFLSIIASNTNIRWISVHHRARHTGENSLLKWGLVKACFKSFSDLLIYKNTYSEGTLPKSESNTSH